MSPSSHSSTHQSPSWEPLSSDSSRVIRVGVIGSGLAGLLSAYALATIPTNLQSRSQAGLKSKERKIPLIEVHIFESSTRLGLSHASTQVSISTDEKLCKAEDRTSTSGSSKRHWNIDSPMRAIQSGYYKHLSQLYKFLGVSLTKTDFSYSFYGNHSSTPSHRSTRGTDVKLLYEGTARSRLGSISKPSHLHSWLSFGGLCYLFNCSQLAAGYVFLLIISALSYHARHQPVWRQDQTVMRFLLAYSAHRLGLWVGLGTEEIKYVSLREWQSSEMIPVWMKGSLSGPLKRKLLEPLFCSICSCSIDELDRYLVTDLLDYMWLTFGKSYYACSEGVKSVTEILIRPLKNHHIHLGLEGTITQILPISIQRNKIEILTKSENRFEFDELVFATQADQLKQLLMKMCEKDGIENQMAEDQRIELLNCFKYCKTLVVNHVDESVLPDQVEDWRDLNFTNSTRSVPHTQHALSSDILQTKTSSQSRSKMNTKPKKALDHQRSKTDEIFDKDSYWMSTHIIHHPTSSNDGQLLLQTTNPIQAIDRSKIINQVWFNRVLVDDQSRRAVQELRSDSKLGLHHIWFTGSWFTEGIPLLEGCVSSSEFVIKRLVLKLLQDDQSQVDDLELKFRWET